MILAALALSACLFAAPAADEVPSRAEVSRPVPSIPLMVQDLQGAGVDLAPRLRGGSSTAAGRAVLLVFWGSWCAPCLREIPELNELQRFYGPRGLEVIGVGLAHVEETPARLAAASRDRKVAYPVYFDAQGAMARTFGVTALPAAALIDGAGVVRWMGPSLPKDINERIQAAVRPGEDSAGR